MFHEYTPEEIGLGTSFAMNLKMVSSKMPISRATPHSIPPLVERYCHPSLQYSLNTCIHPL